MAPASPPLMITRTKLSGLLDRPDTTPVISLFHPTDRVAVEPEENSLHLKNLIVDAQEQLEKQGIGRSGIDELLQPVDALLEDHTFWKNQLEGFAAFRTRDTFEYFRVPFRVPERVFVRDQPYVKPLLPALWPHARFYILAISQHRVRLFECTDHAIDEIDLDPLGIPTTIAEALRYDDLQKPELQHHPVTGSGRGPQGQGGAPGQEQQAGRRQAFHGHGESGEGQKTQIKGFFRQVDEGIMKRLKNSTAPLIVASVEYEVAIYKEVSRYKSILDEHIEGSPDRLSAQDLHAEALPIVDRLHRTEIDELRERHGTLSSQGLASCDAEEIVIAAADGRVETLFLDRDVEQWGSFDPDNRKARLDGTQEDDNLHELAARLTIQNSGAVYVLGAQEMPCEFPMGAIYRYNP